MNFPFKEYASKDERKKNMGFIYIFSILMIIPSLFIFRKVWLEAELERRTTQFVEQYIGDNQIYLDEYDMIVNANKSKTLYLRVWGDIIQKENAPQFEEALKKVNLRNTTVEILTTSEIRLSKIREIEEEVTNLAKSKAQLKSEFQNQQELLKSMRSVDSMRSGAVYADVENELKTLYPNIQSVALAEKDYTGLDSTNKMMHIAIIEWNNKNKSNNSDTEKLADFLQLRLNSDSIRVVSEN